jgi:hypothetical protein
VPLLPGLAADTSRDGTAKHPMTVNLKASTGAKILVWREKDMFAALRAGGTEEAQICLGIDLFEVIAELAELDLDDADQSEEATRLAAEARQRLASLPSHRRP